MIADTAVLILELAVLFFAVAFFVHLSQRWLGEERLRRWMGGRPVVAALKGIAVGFITPFCTYSAIPMLLGLRRAGVSPAGYVAFIVAAPVLDPVLFGALTLIVGIEAALIYVAVAFAGALTLALVAQRIDIERFMRPVDGENESCDTSCAPSYWRGLRPEAREATLAAFSLLRSLGPVLLVGVGIGVAIQLLVPADLVASVAGNDTPFAVPVAAGLGTPLYFNTELFVPIADSLAAVGVGIGAIVALTIAGAGANVPEFVILSRLAKGSVLTVFVGYVFLVAIAGGLLAQTVI
ncbi:MAG: permease [Acidimicrobiia bacterium]